MNFNNTKCDIDKAIMTISRFNHNFFLNKANVIGVGLGYKIKNNIKTCEKCIKVYVIKKISCNRLCAQDIVPPMYKGFKTDIVQTGKFNFARLDTKIRPVLGGYSISPENANFSGTYGCLVEDTFGTNYILSCNHVLSNNGMFPLGTPILQPSTPDGGRFPGEYIAFLSKFIPIHPETPTSKPVNFVDCAMAKVLFPNTVSSRLAIINTPPNGVNAPILNESVKKIGRTTELTQAIIDGIGVTIEIEDTPGVDVLYSNQIVTTNIARKGDSGSILLNYSNQAIGLVFGVNDDANNENYTCCNTITDVLNSLDVRIVTS